MRIAHLTADRIGLSCSNSEHKAPEDNLNFRQHGTFHFAIQDPNGNLLAKIVAAGGKQRMPFANIPDENHIAWFTSKTG
jgi:hypothetical protein